MLSIRYPPYAGKLGKFKKMNELRPNFDRDGKVTVGLLRWLVALGGGNAGAAVKRYIVVVLGQYILVSGCFPGTG